jgi:predicted HicB family RNase H-like nuclease
MENKNQKEVKERMIHVRLPEVMHKKVRVRAAETDQTIQEWVFNAIKHELESQKSEKVHKSK